MQRDKEEQGVDSGRLLQLQFLWGRHRDVFTNLAIPCYVGFFWRLHDVGLLERVTCLWGASPPLAPLPSAGVGSSSSGGVEWKRSTFLGSLVLLPTALHPDTIQGLGHWTSH